MLVQSTTPKMGNHMHLVPNQKKSGNSHDENNQANSSRGGQLTVTEDYSNYMFDQVGVAVGVGAPLHHEMISCDNSQSSSYLLRSDGKSLKRNVVIPGSEVHPQMSQVELAFLQNRNKKKQYRAQKSPLKKVELQQDNDDEEGIIGFDELIKTGQNEAQKDRFDLTSDVFEHTIDRIGANQKKLVELYNKMPKKHFNATDDAVCNILDKDFSFPEDYSRVAV